MFSTGVATKCLSIGYTVYECVCTHTHTHQETPTHPQKTLAHKTVSSCCSPFLSAAVCNCVCTGGRWWLRVCVTHQVRVCSCVTHMHIVLALSHSLLEGCSLQAAILCLPAAYYGTGHCLIYRSICGHVFRLYPTYKTAWSAKCCGIIYCIALDSDVS